MPMVCMNWREAYFTLILILFLLPTVCLEEPQVKTWLGKIRGSWKISNNGRRYAAFEGIPYAKPPVKDLRFEEPQAIDPWQGVWSASKLHTCVQMLKKVEGVEDCLYLNIYVPGEFTKHNKTYEVVVIIHGGRFMTGSPQSMTNSNHFMDKDIIFVTLNYRLGIFGFLSTEDEEIPGNNGLKDQVEALKWVKLNIASFGGNPNAITLAGITAGGACVHLHYFSPLSKGLFVRGISHSGTALHPWAIKRQPLSNAKKLAALIGCNSVSSKEMKKCFKTKQIKEFLSNIQYFYGYSLLLPFAPFGPVIEVKSKHPFLAKNPFSLLHQKQVLDLPWITSSCADEGLLPTAIQYKELQKIDKDWPEIAHFLLDYNYTVPVARRKTVARDIKQFYMGSEKISEKYFQNYTKIFTERLFASGTEVAARLQAKVNQSPVYYYYFNYANGTNNIARNYSLEGVSHGEDLIYFYGAYVFKKFSEEDRRIADACLDILQSFASTGNPAFGRAVLWKPTYDTELLYLNITDSDNIHLHRASSLINMEFWRKLGLLENERLAKDEL